MPTISFATFLMHGTTSGSSTTYTKIFPIKSTPALMAPKEAVETTTLEDGGRTYIPGIRQNDGSLNFTSNYELEYVEAIEALNEADEPWSVWLGGTEQADGTVTPTGQYGKYNFKGRASYSVSEMSVNGVREMTTSIMLSQNMYRVDE
jgi:hypothetical protein